MTDTATSPKNLGGFIYFSSGLNDYDLWAGNSSNCALFQGSPNSLFLCQPCHQLKLGRMCSYFLTADCGWRDWEFIFRKEQEQQTNGCVFACVYTIDGPSKKECAGHSACDTGDTVPQIANAMLKGPLFLSANPFDVS